MAPKKEAKIPWKEYFDLSIKVTRTVEQVVAGVVLKCST